MAFLFHQSLSSSRCCCLEFFGLHEAAVMEEELGKKKKLASPSFALWCWWELLWRHFDKGGVVRMSLQGCRSSWEASRSSCCWRKVQPVRGVPCVSMIDREDYDQLVPDRMGVGYKVLASWLSGPGFGLDYGWLLWGDFHKRVVGWVDKSLLTSLRNKRSQSGFAAGQRRHHCHLCRAEGLALRMPQSCFLEAALRISSWKSLQVWVEPGGAVLWPCFCAFGQEAQWWWWRERWGRPVWPWLGTPSRWGATSPHVSFPPSPLS